jgi:hypothetical protein
VYVRGSTWSPAFKTYLAGHSLGDANLGYRVDNKPGNDIAPWINMDEIVVRYSAPPAASGVPQPGTVLVQGQRSSYSVQTVTQIDPQTFALKLNRNLGVLPDNTDNGDRVTLTVPNGGPGGGNSVTHFIVLGGDVNRNGSVLANDYSEVKARFFKNTTSPVTGTNDYTPFHDVDGNGSILANDYSAVKARFFDNLPPATPAAAGSTAESITSDLFATKRLLE